MDLIKATKAYEAWLREKIPLIELGSLPKTREELKLLHAMGWETANIHLGTKAAAGCVFKDLKRRPGKWLHRAAEAMAKATLEDWKGWAKS